MTVLIDATLPSSREDDSRPTRLQQRAEVRRSIDIWLQRTYGGPSQGTPPVQPALTAANAVPSKNAA